MPSLATSITCAGDHLLPRLEVAIHEGPSGRMLVAGAARWSGYLPDRFVGGGPPNAASGRARCRRRLLGRVPVWRLPALLDRYRSRVDLVCARVDRVSAAWFPRDGYFRAPAWVRMMAPVPPAGARLASGQARRHAALVARNGLTWRVSHDLADLRTFHERDYSPFIRRRHGAEASVRPLAWLGKRFRDGGIVWVERAGEPVAGLVYDVRHGMLRRLASGCVRGDESLLAIGAIAATHLAAFEIARNLGCRQVDLRFCRPCITDGLFQVKRSWGGTLVNDDREGHDFDFLVGWERTTPAVTRFLAATPLVVRAGRGLAALVADPQAAVGLRLPPGIGGIIVPAAAGGCRAISGAIDDDAE